MIAGHEIIGRVTKVGSAVADLKVGDRVGVSPICRSCGSCDECATDHGQLSSSRVPTYNGLYKGHRTFGVKRKMV